jgi:hypothetical protein
VNKSTSSVFTSYFIIIFLTLSLVYNQAWRQHKIISSDVFSYYSYLPALIIRNDIKLQFLDYDRLTPFNELWYSTSDLGIRFTKMPIGWAIMHSPFFYVAHLFAKVSNYKANGFSLPYQIAICTATLFYVCIAVLLLRTFLVQYFSELSVSITLVAIVFGTNLFNYTIFEPGMSHPLSFFLFACFLWITAMWHKKINIINSIALGLILGLITLIRPTNISIILFFIFYDISSWRQLRTKAKRFLQHFSFIILIITASFIIFIPQILYWKIISGYYIFYSYTDEHFFFLRPHILDGLIGFRKGWLLYTPLMSFALLMLLRKRDSLTKWIFGLRLFTLINIFILLSWWCWWYGGSFGGRSFIESYAVLSLPLASFFEYQTSKKVVFYFTLSLTVFFIFLNIYQTLQYREGIINSDSMTNDSYKAVFLKRKLPDNYSSLICLPDYFNAKLGIKERDLCTYNK